MGQYCCCEYDRCLTIYKYPFFDKVAIIPIGVANDVCPINSLHVSNSATNEFLIWRNYGVLDILGFNSDVNTVVQV